MEQKNIKSRDFSDYSINGKGCYRKREAVRQYFIKFFEIHPEMSTEEAYAIFSQWKMKVLHFVELPEEHNKRAIKGRITDSGFDRRMFRIKWPNGELFFSTEWRQQAMQKFVQYANNSGLGVTIDCLGYSLKAKRENLIDTYDYDTIDIQK